MKSNAADHEQEKRQRFELWRLDLLGCAWCGEVFPARNGYCLSCGHRADIPPRRCTCARCEIAV